MTKFPDRKQNFKSAKKKLRETIMKETLKEKSFEEPHKTSSCFFTGKPKPKGSKNFNDAEIFIAIEKKTAKNPKPKKCELGSSFGPPKEIYWANQRNSLRRMIATEVGERSRLVRVNAKLKGYVDAQS
jgi:hypothetical protein